MGAVKQKQILNRNKGEVKMRVLLNILWFVCGGFIAWLENVIIGLLLCCTIIGIPFGLQCFKLADLCATPFGKEIETSGGVSSIFGNVLWILLVGWESALTEAIIGLVLCCTIIGIPFGLQFFKLAGLQLLPFGTSVKVAHVF